MMEAWGMSSTHFISDADVDFVFGVFGEVAVVDGFILDPLLLIPNGASSIMKVGAASGSLPVDSHTPIFTPL